jgi:hypothetical protein
VPSRKEEHYAVRLPNQNPNGLAGSEVRPQPPHCDKNSYILESPPFQCCVDDKVQVRERQPLSCLCNLSFTGAENLVRVLDAEEVSEVAVIVSVVNDEVGDLAGLE